MDDGGSTLWKFAHTLYAEHFGESIDAYIRSVRCSKMEAGLRPRERRFAASSLIHGYAGLECVANMFKFEVYENESSRFFKVVDDADLPLSRFVKEWNWIEIEQRCSHLLHTQNGVLDPRLRARLCEVRKLRHLLAHGYVMPSLALIENIGGVISVVERAVDHPKEHMFPQVRFSRPDKLVAGDAREALDTVLGAAHAIAHSFAHVLSCVSYEIEAGGHPLDFGGSAPSGPFERIFEQIDRCS